MSIETFFQNCALKKVRRRNKTLPRAFLSIETDNLITFGQLACFIDENQLLFWLYEWAEPISQTSGSRRDRVRNLCISGQCRHILSKKYLNVKVRIWKFTVFYKCCKEKNLIQIGTRNIQKFGHTFGEFPGAEKST